MGESIYCSPIPPLGSPLSPRYPEPATHTTQPPAGQGSLGHSPIEGQFVALEQVGAVVGAQGRFGPAIHHVLHLAVGGQQPLLARHSLGPTAPEGSEEPVTASAEVGGEEGVQLLPVGDKGPGKGGLGPTPKGRAGASQCPHCLPGPWMEYRDPLG